MECLLGRLLYWKRLASGTRWRGRYNKLKIPPRLARDDHAQQQEMSDRCSSFKDLPLFWLDPGFHINGNGQLHVNSCVNIAVGGCAACYGI